MPYSGDIFNWSDQPSLKEMNKEDSFCFFIENYFTILQIFRTIESELERIDKIRDECHNELLLLIDQEERWQKRGFPKNFDGEAFQTKKDMLREARDDDYPIIYKDKPLPENEVTRLIINNMSVFKLLCTLDLEVRGKIGPFASSIIKTILKPVLDILERKELTTESDLVETVLNVSIKQANTLAEKFGNDISNPKV